MRQCSRCVAALYPCRVRVVCSVAFCTRCTQIFSRIQVGIQCRPFCIKESFDVRHTKKPTDDEPNQQAEEEVAVPDSRLRRSAAKHFPAAAGGRAAGARERPARLRLDQAVAIRRPSAAYGLLSGRAALRSAPPRSAPPSTAICSPRSMSQTPHAEHHYPRSPRASHSENPIPCAAIAERTNPSSWTHQLLTGAFARPLKNSKLRKP